MVDSFARQPHVRDEGMQAGICIVGCCTLSEKGAHLQNQNESLSRKRGVRRNVMNDL